MAFCKKVVFDNGRGREHPTVILGTVETVREGNAVFKDVITGKGKRYHLRSDQIFGIYDTDEIFNSK